MSSMVFRCLIFVVLMDACFAAKKICPNKSPCLRFSHVRFIELVVTNEGTWIEANDNCISKGGKLADISSEHENLKIWEFLNKIQYFDDRDGVWIGLTDMDEEGTWQWMSSTADNHFSNWAPNQPDPNLEVANYEDCALMESDGKWHDYPCHSKYGWVCLYTNLTDGCLPAPNTTRLH